MRQVTMSVARTHLSELLRNVEAGEVIEIVRRGKLVARLEPMPESEPPQDESPSGSDPR